MNTGNQSTSLYEKIRRWQKQRPLMALLCLLLGLVGLIVPVIPGLLLLAFAFWLIFPNLAERIWKDIKTTFRRA